MRTKLKYIFIFTGSILVLAFFVVYTMSLTGYYKEIEASSNTLTSKAIDRFEKDILNGEKIVASNYLEEKPRYDNLLSRTSIKLGNVIETLFKKGMRSVMKEISGAME